MILYNNLHLHKFFVYQTFEIFAYHYMQDILYTCKYMKKSPSCNNKYIINYNLRFNICFSDIMFKIK